jgi:FAD/FMN-containing dehydrogenase
MAPNSSTIEGIFYGAALPARAFIPAPKLVNDIHSGLNETAVAEVLRPAHVEHVVELVQEANTDRPLCASGGRHSMGGQQFARGGTLVDTRGLDRIGAFDRVNGLIEVGAGIQWPQLIAALELLQIGDARPWCIAQKQTGADRLTLGGALSSNVHGRGLAMRPIISDVESFQLVNARGELLRCSRRENRELFRLAIGGYGLFGIIVSVTLRLVPRQKLERRVDVIEIDDLMTAFDRRIADGFLYGDFQFAIDNASPDFMRLGVFSCYRPVHPQTVVPETQRALSQDDWRNLLTLAHVDKSRCWELYSEHYLKTDGQVYWSDRHQLSTYSDDYHRELDSRLGGCPGSEMITEIYVPRHLLCPFMRSAAEEFRRADVNCVYGTVRLIERDDESYLAWARQDWACVVFNLHSDHDPRSLERSADALRTLIDLAIDNDGSYYLTYHRHATRGQVLACYPNFPGFLRAKRRYDPAEIFQSEWYKHYRTMFSDRLEWPR